MLFIKMKTDYKILDKKYWCLSRDKFEFPTYDSVKIPYSFLGKKHNDPITYLSGNSLGLMPSGTRTAINTKLIAWSKCGVEAYFQNLDIDSGHVS